ncbi:MAG: Vitamin K epoxide reductase [Anaerolineales bacterium]|nr:Vitamin K epoxide reductase [Anaerolineales bacterium]
MDKWLNKALLVLVVIGLLVSIYMTIYKLTDNDAMCVGSGDCKTVNASRFSEINGIPVALVGVGGYAAILAMLLFEKRNELLRKNAYLVLFGFSLLGFLFTLYLVYIEVAVLKAYCPFCIASQATMTLIFILSVIRLVREPQ